MILLIYTATFLPIRTAFIEEDPPGLFEAEIIIDVLFFMDVFINFCSAYIDKNTGFIEARFKNIGKSYLSSWFIFDITACIPF
jgi:uncharacterized membrane protein